MLEQTVLGYGSFEPPHPLWPILNTVYSFDVSLEGFFLWLYGWVLPYPCKILWFPCTLLLLLLLLLLLPGDTPQSSSVRPVTGTEPCVSVSETRGKIGMIFYKGELPDRFVESFYCVT